MNPKLKELAEQAGLYVDLNGQLWPRAMSAEESEVAYEKFAQLIGRECLTLADSIRDGCAEDGENQQALGAAWVGLAIARHFGVE
jgi:hypothetical protein